MRWQFLPGRPADHGEPVGAALWNEGIGGIVVRDRSPYRSPQSEVRYPPAGDDGGVELFHEGAPPDVDEVQIEAQLFEPIDVIEQG